MNNMLILAKKWLKGAAIALFAVALLAGAATSAQAVINGSIQPASGSAVRYGDLTINVAIAPSGGPETIWGMDVYVTYDTNVFDVPSLTDNNLGSGWSLSQVDPNFAPGKVKFSKASIGGPGYTCSSQVNLYRLVFPVKSTAPLGNTTIQIDTTVNKYAVINDSYQVITGSTAPGSFSIGVDTTPPSVLSTAPADGMTNQAVNVAITATFAADESGIDASTITSSNIQVSGSSSGSHTTAPTYNAGTRTVTFNQTGDFTEGETVTCTIVGGAGGVADRAGNEMAADYEWDFTVTSGGGDTITVTSPNGGETWTAGTAEDITWSSTGAITNVEIAYATDGGTNYTVIVASTPNDGTHNWSIPGTINSTQCRIRVRDAADNDPSDASNANFTIQPGGNGPNITSISTTDAYRGQTIEISGSSLVDANGDSTVTVDGQAANPTSFSATLVRLAVPSGVNDGPVNVQVTTADGSDTDTLNILAGGVVIEDYEGGCVGKYVDPTPNSGYHVFEFSEDITPDSNNINDQLRTAAAAKNGGYGASVIYSYVGNDGTDWGGGWGAALANSLNVDGLGTIGLKINWDGSNNDFKLSFKDSAGHVYYTTVYHNELALLGGYGKITRQISNFSEDTDDATRTPGAIDWTDVTGYNLAYITDYTNANPHYIDSIIAGTVNFPDDNGDDNGNSTVEVDYVVPDRGPAGSKFTAHGSGFGAAQGQSLLVFENLDTRTTYYCEIASWSDTVIEAVVPRLAPAGSYSIKVIKISVSQGVMQAYESKEVGFQVTAGTSSAGRATIFPNPFNPLAEGLTSGGREANKTFIAYDAGGIQNVGIYIYDMTARLVYREVISGAEVEIGWDGKDTDGDYVADGLYILRVVNEDTKSLITKGKILVIKKK